MRIVQIVSLNESKSQAYNLVGENFFVATRFRDKIAEGDHVIVRTKSFTSRTDESGEIVDCEEWFRDDVSFIGTRKDCVIALNDDQINAGVDAAIITQEKQARLAALNLTAAQLEETV
jgi:hypothetical protein